MIEELAPGAAHAYSERLKQLRDGVAPESLSVAPPPEKSLRVTGIRMTENEVTVELSGQ